MSAPDGLDVLGRMLPSLAVIVGALLLLRRWAQRGRTGTDSGVRVLTRTGLTRGAVLAVVQIGGHRYLLGAGEHGVTLLTELHTPPDDDSGADAVMDPALPRPASPSQQPWIGLLDRLRRMTVRTPAQRPNRDPRPYQRA